MGGGWRHYTVVTDAGTWRTFAASERKAARNARYRLVMNDRAYERPTADDFKAMREIEVLSVRREDESEETR